jgi:hypothetical protein
MDLGIHPATPNKVDNYQQQKYTSMLLDAFACLLYCLSAFFASTLFLLPSHGICIRN